MKLDTVVLGFDIGGTRVRAAVARGIDILASRSSLWPPGLSPEDEVKFVANLALDLMEETHLRASVKAAGISLAAIVNEDGVVIDWPNRLSWRGLQFRSMIEERIGLPTLIEDDGNAAALAEWAFGAGRGYHHGMVVMIGTGIGAGLILNDRLFRGSKGWAGELGHVTVEPDGPECPCGKRGCLQLLAGGRALDKLAVKRGLGGTNDLVIAANVGEHWAQEALKASGRWIGLALGSVVNLLDLEAIIVGGGLSRLGPPWWTTIEETLRREIFNSAHRGIVLSKALLPEECGLLGAITLACQMSGCAEASAREYGQ
jgi:glucokinase